ncbi:hypothetical protein GCM10025866_17000 [Naasia aerilata]|uniref:Cation efflux protein cytoplasmic domain-containing protein n=1 Tax=Naasia aerilata TaxID=1162966 RepID=A0ABN6XLN0_9MICO|nr:hypothetical protein GCM10025866_17000 [Naasia aerilata]
MLGIPIADPLIGILISLAILVLLWGTVRSIGRRLMDGIEPDLLDRAEHALLSLPEVAGVDALRLRWVGHRLQGDATVVLADMPLSRAVAVAAAAEAEVRAHLPNLDLVRVRTTTAAVQTHSRPSD